MLILNFSAIINYTKGVTRFLGPLPTNAWDYQTFGATTHWLLEYQTGTGGMIGCLEHLQLSCQTSSHLFPISKKSHRFKRMARHDWNIFLFVHGSVKQTKFLQEIWFKKDQYTKFVFCHFVKGRHICIILLDSLQIKPHGKQTFW